jgi:hypothetical protein
MTQTRTALFTTLSTTLVAAGLGLALSGAAQAQPIQSPQDQACRDEATRRVFSDPNPQNLDPYARGRVFWNACMARGKGKATTGRKKRSRRG